MVSFLRKVRMQDVSSFGFSRYFLFACAEIILVVLGILIALQVDEWRTEEQNRATEEKILFELINDLKVAKTDLHNDIISQVQSINRTEKLKNHLLDQKPYFDSVRTWLISANRNTQFRPRTSGYRYLESKGLDILLDDTLRNEIVHLFDVRFNQLISLGSDFDQYNNPTIHLEPFLEEYLIVDRSLSITIQQEGLDFQFLTDFVKLKNYDEFVDDELFIALLQKTIYDRGSKIMQYKTGLKQIEKIIELIESRMAGLPDY